MDAGAGIFGSGLEPLFEALEGPDGLQRKRAREILTLAGDPVIPRLQELLSSSRRLARWEAAKTLVAMVDPNSVDTFVTLLADANSELRWLAASGLIALGPRAVVPVLRSLLGPSPPRGRLQMSHRVLKGLSAENDVLASVVEPLLAALKGSDITPVAPAAAQALVDIGELVRA